LEQTISVNKYSSTKIEEDQVDELNS